MFTHTLTVNSTELRVLLDALKKGESRHESYAKFYPGRRSAEHLDYASIMRRLRRNFETYKAAEPR